MHNNTYPVIVMHFEFDYDYLQPNIMYCNTLYE